MHIVKEEILAKKYNFTSFFPWNRIKDVRIPRQAKATGKHNIKYCFVEFSDESTCDSTKDKLAANPDFVVDYVGEKSKNRQANASAGKQCLHHSVHS